MSVSIIGNDRGMSQPLLGSGEANVQRLTEKDKREALAFLSARPLYTVCMSSYIRNNGVVSSHNRGTFYGYRNAAGSLAGIALIGHATLIETQCDTALRSFARLEHLPADSNFIRGEREMIERFWNHYAELGHEPRLVCRELLFEQTSVSETIGPASDLQPASIDDLEPIISINAEMIVAERGINPLQNDPAGFRQRVARRIKKGQFWVLKEHNKIIFKADVFAEVPEMAYLEGIYVHPEKRGKGLGLRCLSQLGRILLARTRATCLLVNERNKDLQHFYRRAGYEIRGYYDTIYLNSIPN